MDLSTSMRFGTLLGTDFYTSSRVTNNPDTNVPAFGQYSDSGVKSQIVGPTTNTTSNSGSYRLTPSNTTTGNSYYSKT
jgi:hypothetical protein